MSYFIQGDNFENVGGEAEEIVWKRIKTAFDARDVLGYSKYPFFKSMGGKRREPDIMLLDQEEGLLVFEVKGYHIDQIEKIEANQWYLRDCYEQTVNPLSQVADYVFAIVNAKFEVESELRGKVKGRGIVVLPYITYDEWQTKGFDKISMHWPILFKDDLTKQKLLSKSLKMEVLKMGTVLSNVDFKVAKSILGHEDTHVYESDRFLPIGTKGHVINKLKSRLYELDLQQEVIGKTIPPGPQRIRGIAGSGKTLLLCQKAAYMHLKYPEWKISYVFYTRSLYDIVINTIDNYLKAFSNGEMSYNPKSNLQVLHAWGGKGKAGFYSTIANQNNEKPLTVRDCQSEFDGYVSQGTSINYISKVLLEKKSGNLERIFDVILIDEGQDLISPKSQQYNGHHSFYYMAYQSIKPHQVDGKTIRRLIWAYDELQNLDNNLIPTWKEVIGDDESMGKGPTYKGGIKKSEIMRKCYRVPDQVLPIAHALGMGWFRRDGMLTGYTRKEHWEDIGYQVVGDFRKDNSEIILTRNPNDSVQLLSTIYSESVIAFETFNNDNEMIKKLAAEIKNDLTVQGLKAERDILIINLKEKDKQKNYLRNLVNELQKENINYFVAGNSNVNEVDSLQKNPDYFWKEGAITISSVARAKGNEASMVYIVGLDEIARNEKNEEARNKLFVALTRTKCFVKLMAVGDYSLYDEIDKAIQSKGIFKFNYKRPKNVVDDYDKEELAKL